MKYLDRIRSQSREKKIRLIWIISGVAILILLILWGISYKFNKRPTIDTSVFDTAGRGLNDFKNNYDKPIQY